MISKYNAYISLLEIPLFKLINQFPWIIILNITMDVNTIYSKESVVLLFINDSEIMKFRCSRYRCTIDINSIGI